MSKLIHLGNMIIVLLFALVGCQKPSDVTKVGIIIPIEHKALDEIVNGFKTSLQKLSTNPIQFKIANAQGDMNLQRAIISQMKDEHYDLIVPIATVTTEMAASMVQEQPIVSLAATYTQAERDRKKHCNIAVVHDEIPPEKLIAFIHDVYPQLTQLTLIHSADDKIYRQLKPIKAVSDQYGIKIKTMMAPSLNELYSVASSIPATTQGILVLKDNMIASGIDTLEIAAAKRKIPLITSDQGTVEDGAAFSLGVHERDIGVAGAKLAERILNGQSPCSLPIVEMDKLTVFVNKKSLQHEHQALDPILSATQQKHYTLEFVNEANGNA